MHVWTVSPSTSAGSQAEATRGTLVSWKLALYGSNLSRHDIENRRRCGRRVGEMYCVGSGECRCGVWGVVNVGSGECRCGVWGVVNVDVECGEW